MTPASKPLHTLNRPETRASAERLPRLRPLAAGLALAGLTGLVITPMAWAQTGAAPGAATPQRITITRTLPAALDEVPGASALVSEQQLRAERPYSVREALQGVPGLHVVGEDAFGMNLNIGIRGLDPRRTSRTLLLEDGMPVHLAPYSDPSAHYHTPLERVQRIEVIKGSGQIVHGPQTVGGVINFVTTPVPRSFAGTAELGLGNRGFRRLSAGVGSGWGSGGWLLQATQRQGDGTREGQAHEVRDLSLKAEVDLDPRHSLSAKLSFSSEDSKFGEAGLDQARFDRNPYANPFRNDVFELERTAVQLVHRFDFAVSGQLSTQLYYQDTFRASYRQLDAVAEFDGIEDVNGVPTALLEFGSLRSRAPDSGARNPDCRIDGSSITYEVPNGWEERAALCGNQMRPRSYVTYGVEPRLTYRFQAGGVQQDLVAGLRLHEEDIERRRYNGTTPTARADSPGTFYRDRNDIQTSAVAAYVQSTLHIGDWRLTPGLRLERYTQRNTAVLARRDRDVNNGRSVEQSTSRLLPGLAAALRLNPQTTVYAGLHRGFAPPRPDANLSPLDSDFQPVDPETSTNLELGLRQARPGLQWEATLFHIRFDNQIVPGYAVGVGQTFANAGSSRHTGVELGGRLDLARSGAGRQLYLTGSLTHLAQAEFSSRLLTPVFGPGDEETTAFADAQGKRLPYAPKNTASLGLGFEHPAGWDARLGLTHVGRQFSDALNTTAYDPLGSSGAIPAYTLLNASANWRFSAASTAFLSVTNLADKAYLVSRVNGAFAGARRNVVLGLRTAF